MSLLLCVVIVAADDPPVEPGPVFPKTNAADRVRSINNLKMIGLAFHNYHDSYNGMPAAAAFGTAKKPLLSWRVAILPYIEEDKLFKEFKLDEPWDSKHNKKLLDKMPAIFAPTIRGKPDKAGHTYYQVFTGPDTPFNIITREGSPRLGPRLANFTDGTSNTILVVEAEKPVPWTKPEDIVYDPKKPLPKLGGLFKDRLHVVMGDGAVRVIGRKVKEAALRAIITPSGGEIIDWKDLPGPEKEKEKK
jgi:hypothetical protein